MATLNLQSNVPLPAVASSRHVDPHKEARKRVDSAPHATPQKVEKHAQALLNEKGTTQTRQTSSSLGEVSGKSAAETKRTSFSFSSLQKKGLSSNECKKVEAFYNKWKGERLSSLSGSKYIKHHSNEAPDLPRSVVLIPEGPRKGIYMILKEEIDKGAFNVVHELITLDNGAMDKVWRVARVEDVENELEVIHHVAKKPHDFLIGDIVKFLGTWRSRLLRLRLDENEKDPIKRIQKSKQHLEKETKVNKIGMLMDRAVGGNLRKKLWDDNFCMETNPNDRKKGLKIMQKCAEMVDSLHKINLVHLDLKSENIFVGSDETLKLGDFGSTVWIGKDIGPDFGTRAFLAPEVLAAKKQCKKYRADEKADIWSLGCCFLDILSQKVPQMDWFDLFEKANSDYLENGEDYPNIEAIKNQMLPGRNDGNHSHYALHSLIDKCLSLKPQERPSAEQVAEALKNLSATLTATLTARAGSRKTKDDRSSCTIL